MLQKDYYKEVTDYVYIIGGGPSIKNQNIEGVKNKPYVIACNTAYRMFPNAFIGLHVDYEFWNWHQHCYLDIFKGAHAIATAPNSYSSWPRITKYKQKQDVLLNEDFPFISGNNCGYSAINIAYILGFKNIVLLGFDLKKSETGETHYHSGTEYTHKRETNTDMWQSRMLPEFENLAIKAPFKELNIINTNFDSAIRGFEFRKLETLV